MSHAAPPDGSRPDADAQARIIKEHLWLAEKIAREMAWLAPKTVGGAVLGPAYEGLALAAAGFDPTRSRPFAVYAYKWIVGAILDEVERLHPGFTRVHRAALDACDDGPGDQGDAPALEEGADPLDPVVADMWLSEVTLRVGRRDGGRSEAEQRALAFLDEELERLDKNGRTLLLRHAEGATWEELATKLGLSVSTVKRRGVELRALLLARLRARGVP